MKRCLAITLFVFALFSTVFAETSSEPASHGIPLDSVVAVVNDDVITASELNHQVAKVSKQLASRQIKLPSEDELRWQVLNYLIDQKVELQTAARAGIEVDDATLDASIEQIAAHNKASLAELKKVIENDGLSFGEYRAEIRKEMLVERLLQREIGSRITISKQETDKYLHSLAYEKQNVVEYHLEDILIGLPEAPSSAQLQEAQKIADDIRVQLKQGRNFQELALAKSTGQEALSGGDLGWRRIEEIPTAFASLLSGMKPGDVSDPIRTGNGIHLIKLVDRRGNAGVHHTTETQVRHILLKTSGTTTRDNALKAELERIRTEIEHGASFAEMAKRYSQDTVSALKGGELGWIKPGMLVVPFEQAMNQLKPGIISEPVKTQFGWHIIQVEGRREVEDTAEYQEQQIRRRLYERQYEENTQLWVKRMRDASSVQILIPKPAKS